MRFSVPADHPCLPGHFPGRPLVPGVVILEQVLAAVEAQGAAVGPLRLPQVKFLRPLLPDQPAQIALERAGPGRWRFQVLRGDEPVASGEVVAEAA